MAYKSIFEEEEIKPATTPKASTGYVSIFDNEEKKPEPIVKQEVQKPKYLGDLLKELPKPKPTPAISGRYVQDPTRSNVSIPFEKAPLKTQIENLTPEELRKMKTSELYELKRVAGMEEGDAKQWYSSLMAGFGDVADIIGSTMKWQGAEGGLIDRIGENLQEVGRATQSKYTDYEALEKLGEFDWGDMAKPSFWQNKVPRLLPFSMSLIPAALIGGAVGTSIGASLGLGALVATITGAIGGAALSRPIEGMMEAGSTYDEAIKKGLSEEKAQEAANEVFIENLKQMSVLDAVQMLPFIKNIKGFKIPNSTVNKIVNIVGTTGAVASEGFEEVLQNKIVSDALGEKFDLASPETKESFVLGTIMGGVFQGTGGIVNISQRAITNATKENLSKKNQAIFEKNFDKFMKEGETRSDSEVLALNEVAKIDQKGLQDAITKTLNEKSQELKDAGIEQQASTVLKEETPADKLAKQIKKSDPIDRLLATIEEQEVETKAEEPLTKITGKRIPTLEKEISSIYKKSGKADEKFYEILTELEVAEAGKRFSTEDGDWTGIKSTFPKWIPEHLRSRDLFNKVMGGLSDPNNIKYPEANKTKQRELYNVILDELDSRLEVDTKDIRNNILKQYEQKPKRKTKKVARRSTRRTKETRPEEGKEVARDYVKELVEQEDLGLPMFQEVSRVEEIYEKGKEIVDKSIKNKEAVILDPDELKKIYNDYDPKNHKIYSSVNKKLFEYALKNVKNKTVKFIAGGSGSGKSNFVTSVLAENFNGIILDGTLSNYDSFIDKLIIAKENGKKVKVSGIITNVGRAWKYVKKREKETGRGVPLDVFIDKHIGSAQTMIKIIENNNDVAVELKDTRKIRGEDSAKNVKFLNDKKYILAILRGLNYNKDVIRKKLEYEDTTRKIKISEGAKQKASRIEMDKERKEGKLKGDKQGISYAKTPERISKLPKGDRADKIEKYQELSNEDALIEEAKKYKSAEEFIKGKLDKLSETTKSPITVYRGEGKGIGNVTLVEGRYFADSKKFASKFGKVSKSKIPAGSKIFDLDKVKDGSSIIPQELLVDPKSLTKFLIDNGFDATKNTNASGVEYVILNKKHNELLDMAMSSKSPEIFNKKALDRWDYFREEINRIGADGSKPGFPGYKSPTQKIWEESKTIRQADKQLTDIWNKANETKYQELGESTKLPDIQLKKDVVTKDMQGNKITLKEGEAFSVYELPKSRYLLEGKESYTVPKNQFQNIKGQSIIAEKKEFAPELKGTEEDVKGLSKWRGDELYDNGKRLADVYKGEDGKWHYRSDFVEESPAFKTRQEAMENAEADALGIYSGNETKFEQYTLPNGENYREILIKAPNRGEQLTREMQDLGMHNEATPENLAKYNAMKKELEGTSIFKSSHWDEPNVLFHLRMNDRKYNGKKVSFMEEFQSDWAMEGRDKGFSKNLPKGTENDIEIKFVKSNVPEGHDPKNYPGYYEAFDKRTGDFLGRGGTKPDLMERALEEINLTEGVPYNPLLKNWQVSAIKRALLESVDADYFAWTTGEQQKARYDLSKYLDNVGWKTIGPEKQISLKITNGGTIYLGIDEKGIIGFDSSGKDLKGKKLDEFIGKGLADKIMSKESGNLSEEGLKFGGEWAISLYDIQAKKIVEELTGGKVEMIDLGLPVDKAKNNLMLKTKDFADLRNLKQSDLKVGVEVLDSSTPYIITDILGEGKFKAVPKSSVESPYSDWKEMMKLNPQLENLKETFDISEKTTLQPALKLTPEIKAIIKGEAPQLKVEQKLYQTPSQGSQVLVETIQRITTEEALAQAQDFAIVRDTNIPIKAVETIIENPRAFGKYQKGTIEFIYNPDITTIPHEIGHYWFEAMLTKDQQTEVLREYKEWFIKNKPNKARPDTRNGWEEAMVQDMAEYYSKKYTKKKGKIERFWDWFIYQIKRVLNKNDFIARFTYDVRTKSIDRNVSKRKLADSLNQTGAIRTNGGIIIPDETKEQAFRRKIQDLNTRLDTTVRTLREGGVVIPESQDIFLAKTLLPRRIGGATEKFANEVMNPLINAMAKDGIDLDNLNLYLHAMHAPERNRKMNELRKAENDKRNRQRVVPKPYFPVDGLSGMTDAEARSVINTFKEMGIASKLEEHRISLQKISKATLLFQLKEGLLSQEEYDAIRGSYEYYVPLGRDIEDNAKGWGTGKGVNIKGKEIKRARGSQDLPVLPIVSQIFNRMNTAIVRAEKNRVALSVARLIKANPKIKTKTGKELWTIKSEKYIPRYDSFGEVEYVEPLGARSQKPNEIAFKYKGKQKYLVINDPLLVRALTEEGKSKPIPYLTRYTSLLSRLATQYNPEFIIRNFSRDISESLVNVIGIAENYLTKEQTKGLKSDILKSIPKLFGAIYGYKSRKESHGAKELIDEFIKNGGEVGYFWLEDEKTLDQKFKRQWRKSAPKGFSDKMKNKMSDFMDFVGNVNSTVELVTRVAVYKALRERGMSAKQSAQIAGDITVDFNKKGEWGALISSMYMFFNASVQGAARVSRSIKSSKKVRVMTAALFIGGFLNGIISQLWGDGDDEDYDQFIPDYKKNTRIVFADPTGKEWTVFFLPYGFGFFWAAGRSFSEVVRGKKDILESSGNVTRAFVQSFLPIDVMGGWKEFVPSSVKPLVEVATNEAWYDAPIAPDQPAYQPKIPESQRYFKTASNMSKSLSTWLNSVTGGDENRSGIVDISPEFIDYLWQQYTSGAGSFIGNVAETGYGIVKGDVKKERIPFVRSFVADVKKESVIKSNVYDIIDEGARRMFNQDKKDKFYKQVDWLIKNGSLSEDEQENIDKGNELKLNFLKGQYNFTLGDKISILEAIDKMSDKDVEIFYESLTPKQIKSIRTGK